MRITTILAAALAALALGATSALAAERPSLADEVAAKLGVSTDQLRAAFRAALAARVDAAVAAGRLTPEQGARLKEHIANAKGFGLGARKAFGEKRKALAERIAKHGTRRGAAAQYLGLSRAQLRAELRKGQSLAQIATARGKSVDGLVAAMLSPVRERLAKAVAGERLTQQRSDALLERITNRVERLVQRTFVPKLR